MNLTIVEIVLLAQTFFWGRLYREVQIFDAVPVCALVLQTADGGGARGRATAGQPSDDAAAARRLPQVAERAAAGRPAVHAQLLPVCPAQPAAVGQRRGCQAHCAGVRPPVQTPRTTPSPKSSLITPSPPSASLPNHHAAASQTTTGRFLYENDTPGAEDELQSEHAELQLRQRELHSHLSVFLSVFFSLFPPLTLHHLIILRERCRHT